MLGPAKTDQVNKELKRICSMDKHCEYADHDTNFTLSDKSSNDALYLFDGVHLNNKGSTKLVNNLGLSDMVTIKKPLKLLTCQ